MSIWRGVPVALDAAFKYGDGKTYFFKGSQYWKFYDPRMRVEREYPRLIAKDWLQCSDTHIHTVNNPASDPASNRASKPASNPAQHRKDQGFQNSAAALRCPLNFCLAFVLSAIALCQSLKK